jgi:isopentenyl diphosphate isomerase/L-lactate dehydrogenase-like FMN-dependent dehydrogenase
MSHPGAGDRCQGRLCGTALSVGLGAFGEADVERVLAILRAETRIAMQQLGAPSLKDSRSGDGTAGLAQSRQAAAVRAAQ